VPDSSPVMQFVLTPLQRNGSESVTGRRLASGPRSALGVSVEGRRDLFRDEGTPPRRGRVRVSSPGILGRFAGPLILETGRELLDGEPLLPDSQAHRATRVAQT